MLNCSYVNAVPDLEQANTKFLRGMQFCERMQKIGKQTKFFEGTKFFKENIKVLEGMQYFCKRTQKLQRKSIEIQYEIRLRGSIDVHNQFSQIHDIFQKIIMLMRNQ